MGRRVDPRWLILAVIAAAVAARTILIWAQIVPSGVPTGYGEGAVEHAGQIIARGGDPYASDRPGYFVSAIYPPLAYAVTAVGTALGPFTALRLVSVLACCAVAILAGWRARASPVVAVALGASFLALYPVAAWGSGARVDPLAVAFTAFAVVTASSDPRRAALAGAFGALALAAKPTEVLPLGAVLAYCAWRERAVALRFGIALAVACVAVLAVILLRFDAVALWRHLVAYNLVPYEIRNSLFLMLLGLLLMGAVVGVALYVADGRMRAYMIGALGVVALGGREGATYNYLLDLCAAASVALAPLAVRSPGRAPALFVSQLVATLILSTLGPLAPPSTATLYARVEASRDLPAGAAYAEDSGLLIAVGRDPVVDDVFQWARLVAIGTRPDDVTPLMRDGAFAVVLSDIDLTTLDTAPLFEQHRWPPQLAAAVLERYRLERHASTLWIYLPR